MLLVVRLLRITSYNVCYTKLLRGSLEEVAKYGLNDTCGILVNSSRQIIYASSEADYATAARTEAQKVQEEMEKLLSQKGLI